MKTAAKIVSGDTVRDVTQQLASQHRPAKWNIPLPEAVTTAFNAKATQPAVQSMVAAIVKRPITAAEAAPSAASNASENSGPQCKRCQSRLGSILYGKYGYYFQCTKCAVNTDIKFSCLPGHKPRLRKSGKEFFRDCAECGSSGLCFTNS